KGGIGNFFGRHPSERAANSFLLNIAKKFFQIDFFAKLEPMKQRGRYRSGFFRNRIRTAGASRRAGTANLAGGAARLSRHQCRASGACQRPRIAYACAPMPRGYCRGWHDGARQGRSTEAASVACRRARRNARLSANVQGARDQILMEMRRASSRELGPYRRHELLTGECVYAVRGSRGYGSAARARPI